MFRSKDFTSCTNLASSLPKMTPSVRTEQSACPPPSPFPPSQKEKRRRDCLADLLAKHGSLTPFKGAEFVSAASPGGAQAPLSSLEASGAMQAALRRFVMTYSSDMAVEPFLKGLVTLMEKQQGVRGPTPVVRTLKASVTLTLALLLLLLHSHPPRLCSLGVSTAQCCDGWYRSKRSRSGAVLPSWTTRLPSSAATSDTCRQEAAAAEEAAAAVGGAAQS